uniref:Putative myeloid leukemia factor 1 n=1 Tax=Davidia involucrata TaxID=16924 RepID=A0A5B6Z4E5_DAVIN
MFESSFFGPTGSPFPNTHTSRFIEHQVPQSNKSKGPIIEELNSDDEREEESKKEKKDNPRKHGRSSKEPYVEVLDDEADERRSKQMQYRNDFNRVNNTHTDPQTHSFTFQSSTVTYGGANGVYYTSSRTSRTGSDGLTVEESKAADTATGQAAHRIARGIHDKGHFVTRKLNSDGRVDTIQTLHNLNEAAHFPVLSWIAGRPCRSTVPSRVHSSSSSPPLNLASKQAIDRW